MLGLDVCEFGGQVLELLWLTVCYRGEAVDEFVYLCVCVFVFYLISISSVTQVITLC